MPSTAQPSNIEGFKNQHSAWACAAQTAGHQLICTGSESEPWAVGTLKRGLRPLRWVTAPFALIERGLKYDEEVLREKIGVD